MMKFFRRHHEKMANRWVIITGLGVILLLLAILLFSGSSEVPVVQPQPNPVATTHLPMFVAGPGETDVFFNIVIVVLTTVVLLVGVFYFTLHSIPERMAHNSRQMQIVAILSLIALFTHNNYFWIAALLLAAIRLPDFTTPLNSIAGSLKTKHDAEKQDA